MTCFTIELAVLYPSEYELKVWFGTVVTSEKPSYILITHSKQKALDALSVLDDFLKTLDNLEGKQ